MIEFCISLGLSNKSQQSLHPITNKLYTTANKEKAFLHTTIFQGVTLGGTGKEDGDRHPKVREGVLLSAASTVLGNVEIGKNAKVAAGSVVLKDVKEHTTVAGVPAKEVGEAGTKRPAHDVDHMIEGK